MKVVLLVALFAIVFAVEIKPKVDHVARMFSKWQIKYNKVYATAAEQSHAFDNFKASLERSKLRNAKATNAKFGLTKFSDLSVEEFKAKYLTYKPSPHVGELAVPDPAILAAPPKKFDWRDTGKVTAVKDQQQCGSCWAFSTTENIESVWMIKKGITNSTMPALSPEQIVDCDTTDGGCNGGWPSMAMQYVIGAGGMMKDSDYPYTAGGGSAGQCVFDKTKVYATISAWKTATQPGDENTMVANLVSLGGLSIAVDAEPWQDYQSGILMASDCGSNLDHAVQLVGYDLTNNPPFYYVRNSWNTNWGEMGYIRLQYGTDCCALTSNVTCAVV